MNILEDYLYHQIRSEEYDCLANLAILKLCVHSPFNPTTSPILFSSLPGGTTTNYNEGKVRSALLIGRR